MAEADVRMTRRPRPPLPHVAALVRREPDRVHAVAGFVTSQRAGKDFAGDPLVNAIWLLQRADRQAGIHR